MIRSKKAFQMEVVEDTARLVTQHLGNWKHPLLGWEAEMRAEGWATDGITTTGWSLNCGLFPQPGELGWKLSLDHAWDSTIGEASERAKGFMTSLGFVPLTGKPNQIICPTVVEGSPPPPTTTTN